MCVHGRVQWGVVGELSSQQYTCMHCHSKRMPFSFIYK